LKNKELKNQLLIRIESGAYCLANQARFGMPRIFFGGFWRSRMNSDPLPLHFGSEKKVGPEGYHQTARRIKLS
jgi:hypothetical protein